MTAIDLYRAGLRAGYLDESHGIIEPEHGYRMDEPYRAGVRAGRASWRRDSAAALVVDREPASPWIRGEYSLAAERNERR